jgi:hypothetical protein
MERLLKEERLASMRLGLTLTTDAVKIEMDVEIEVEKKIDAAGVIDAAEGVINKAIRFDTGKDEKALLANLHAIRAFLRTPWNDYGLHHSTHSAAHSLSARMHLLFFFWFF